MAVDCLPVVVKFFGGTSGYDELFKLRAASAQRIFAEQVVTEERRLVEGYTAEQDEIDRRARMRRAEHDLSLQEHEVGLRARRGDAVKAYADELLGGAGRRPDPGADGPSTSRPDAGWYDTNDAQSSTRSRDSGRSGVNGHTVSGVGGGRLS